MSYTLFVMPNAVRAAEPELTFKQRRLYAAIQPWRERGWQLQSVTGDYATLVRMSNNFLFDALTALITCGLWLIYVIYRMFKPTYDTLVFKVDDFGNVRLVSQAYNG